MQSIDSENLTSLNDESIVPGAAAHGNLYSLPLGRVQILMLRQQIFHYPLLTFLYPLQMYHLFLRERAPGTDSPDPFSCLRNIPARIWCLGIRLESGIVLRRNILVHSTTWIGSRTIFFS